MTCAAQALDLCACAVQSTILFLLHMAAVAYPTYYAVFCCCGTSGVRGKEGEFQNDRYACQAHTSYSMHTSDHSLYSTDTDKTWISPCHSDLNPELILSNFMSDIMDYLMDFHAY